MELVFVVLGFFAGIVLCSLVWSLIYRSVIADHGEEVGAYRADWVVMRRRIKELEQGQ